MLKYSKSIIGDKYGMLTVLSLHSNINYRKKFNCLCDCGNTRVVAMSHLRPGHTKTCGCIKLNGEYLKSDDVIHYKGKSYTVKEFYGTFR